MCEYQGNGARVRGTLVDEVHINAVHLQLVVVI